MRIYIGNLPYRFRSNDLKKIFEPFGHVESARVILDKETKKSKGFGFVEMPDKNEAEKAIKSLNQTEVDNRIIKVSEANNKQNNL